MTPAEIVLRARADGVRISVLSDRTIRLEGSKSAAQRCYDAIVPRRGDVLAVLQEWTVPNASDAIDVATRLVVDRLGHSQLGSRSK